MGTAPHLRNVTPSALRMCSHLPTATASTFARLTGTRTPAREQLTGPRNLGLMPPCEDTRYRHQALPPQGRRRLRARRGGQRRQGSRGEARVEGLGQTRRRAARGLGARRRVAGPRRPARDGRRHTHRLGRPLRAGGYEVYKQRQTVEQLFREQVCAIPIHANTLFLALAVCSGQTEHILPLK